MKFFESKEDKARKVLEKAKEEARILLLPREEISKIESLSLAKSNLSVSKVWARTGWLTNHKFCTIYLSFFALFHLLYLLMPTLTHIKMKVFESKNLVLERDDQLQCLIQNWKGFAPSNRFREGILKSIELFKDKKLNKILSNTKESGMVKKEDTEWVSTYSMPLLVENGLKFMAFVVPANVFAQMSIENFKKGSAGPVEIRYFDDVDKARKWMAEATS